MIPTVLGPIEGSSVTGSCSPHEQLLHKPSPADRIAIHNNPITLPSLAEIRSNETDRFAVSNRLFSLDESAQELGSFANAGGGLVLECSTSKEGRDPSGLAEISRRTGVRVVMAASWSMGMAANSASGRPSAETIGKELERQLLFGEHVEPTAAVATTTNTSRIQAGFLVINLVDDSFSRGTAAASASAAAPADMLEEPTRALQGAALAQQATAAPIVMICPPFFPWRRVESALAIATANWGNGSDVGKNIILAGMHGGVAQSLSEQVAILRKGVVLCFDCFGRVEWLPGPDYYPPDEESAVRIAELARQGFADRIVLSQGVSRRIHLSRFGGHGYGHALRTVPPRLRRLGVSAEDITCMTRDNMLRLLDWYTPPPPLQIPKDYLPCSWCKTRFEPVEGEYFHKFRFVYCGIKCLRLHRDTSFDPARVDGGE